MELRYILPIASVILLATLAFSFVEKGVFQDDGKNYYQKLGLESDATPKLIRRTYRKLAVTMHPDKLVDPSMEADQVEVIQDAFVGLARAYEVLSDSISKQRYDYLLSRDEEGIYTEYDPHFDYSFVDQALGLKPMHHRTATEPEAAGFRDFMNFEEAERLYQEELRQEQEEIRRQARAEQDGPLLLALGISLVASILTAVWWARRQRKQKEDLKSLKKKKKAHISEEEKIALEKKRQEAEQKKMEEESDRLKQQEKQKQSQRNGKKKKLKFAPEDPLVQRIRQNRKMSLAQALDGTEVSTILLQEFANYLEEISATLSGKASILCGELEFYLRCWRLAQRQEELSGPITPADQAPPDPHAQAQPTDYAEAVHTLLDTYDVALSPRRSDSKPKVAIPQEIHHLVRSELACLDLKQAEIVDKHKARKCLGTIKRSYSSESQFEMDDGEDVEFLEQEVAKALLRGCQTLAKKILGDDTPYQEWTAFTLSPRFIKSANMAFVLADLLDSEPAREIFQGHLSEEGLLEHFDLWSALFGFELQTSQRQKALAKPEEKEEAEQYLAELLTDICEECCLSEEECKEEGVDSALATYSSMLASLAGTGFDLEVATRLSREIKQELKPALAASLRRFKKGEIYIPVLGECEKSKAFDKMLKDILACIK
mmetsp:Transcript_17756/g.22853  ORF Transcript_17756/g.22853 Transcript_17756/m.22853 type:complete len:659 (+) Transcript_17756:63-2039(+)|eukprot:CAMPEP_0117866352 /NCGR_PEP_ID=MMETSP0950-20121206/7306_1 /TAXON_ID=44440 /ORGANISM="Chattonella subsalsa, Strain CCMP2191" /LENGTH=658 /DNA_ID=CAMNT_0005717657 /DNA_START=29 /DNA_END=2005 /DNA_ORIENTATION=-